MIDDRHVVPTSEPHDTNGRDACACRPIAYKPCDECGESINPGCWQCGGSGLLPLDVLGDDDTPCVVVHNRQGTL
jgi:hypothetical protein